MKICLIEDEESIAQPLKRMLEQAGFAVDWLADGEQGATSVERNSYDCVLLDLHLPTLDGIGVMKRLRSGNILTPVIMLTARSQVYDKLEGFDVGADDYVTKPFHTDELIARIRAVIKRSSDNKTDQLQFGDYTLLPQQNIVHHSQGGVITNIELTSKETAILEYLLRNPNKIVSAEELLEHVWDREVNLFTDTVKTHIKTLRQKVDPQKQSISTIRGKGYKIHII